MPAGAKAHDLAFTSVPDTLASGMQNIYKIYAGSFRDERRLQSIMIDDQKIVDNALTGPTKS